MSKSVLDGMTEEEKKAYSEAMGYDVEAYEYYLKQQIRPSNEEIARVAERLWADEALGPVFRRAKMDGDLTDEEHEAAKSFISAQQTGEMWDRRFMDLWLATGLVRRRAAGLIDDFHGEEARAFIADRLNPSQDGQIGSTVPCTLDEVLDFARALLNNPEIVEADRLRPESAERSEEQIDRLNVFLTMYQWKHCLLNRNRFPDATYLLGKVTRGEFDRVDHPELIKFLKKYYASSIRWPEGGGQ